MSKAYPSYKIIWYNGGERAFRKGYDSFDKAWDFFTEKVKSPRTDYVQISDRIGTLQTWTKDDGFGEKKYLKR